MNEIWKAVVGYEGLYEVSNMGNVRSLYDGRHQKFRTKVLKSTMNHKGYLRVSLYNSGNRKIVLVHRLVAEAFLDNLQQLSEVNHRNEIKTDNRVENLEWMSHQDNCNYGTHNQRMSEALRGKHQSEETKRKISESLSGKHHSDKSKLKISESVKRYWLNKKVSD